jgi:DNA (cytosine-5)-methyltransferase 1
MIDIELVKSNSSNLGGLKFIDLFAGIGGFHLALSSFNIECVFASEWDKYSQNVYKENFGISPFGDITKISEKDIPPHDVICGGFPCQAFSISGKQRGFEDSRGTLFFDIARITEFHKPKVLLLENVFNFEKHDNGRTLEVVLKTLDNIGYNVYYKVLNAVNYGIPQIRKRIYFVGFRKDLCVKNFKFPNGLENSSPLNQFLEVSDNFDEFIIKEEKLKNLKINLSKHVPKQNLFDTYNSFETVRLGSINKGGQGERIYSPFGSAITLSAYGGGIGAKTGLYYIDNKIRKLTPRECANISGFPVDFKLHSNKNISYKQFGNTVVVDVLQYILIQINKVI